MKKVLLIAVIALAASAGIIAGPPPTFTVTPTVTETITETVTETVSGTVTATVTATVTITVTATITETITETLTFATSTITPTYTITPTINPSWSMTVTPTVTATGTETVTYTITPTSTITPTFTPWPVPQAPQGKVFAYPNPAAFTNRMAIAYPVNSTKTPISVMVVIKAISGDEAGRVYDTGPYWGYIAVDITNFARGIYMFKVVVTYSDGTTDTTPYSKFAVIK